MAQDKMQMMSKMMEEKHVFTYKKLVVPMSMRSIYWTYFGFPATDEGDILTKVKIVCVLCKTQISYNRNTSNLRMHLQNKHASEFFELEANSSLRRLDTKEKCTQGNVPKTTGSLRRPPNIYTTAAEGLVQIDGDVQFITDPNIDLQDFEETSNENNVRVVLKSSSPDHSNQNVAIILPEENVDDNHHDVIDGKMILDAIINFVILDLQLPDVVEGHGFQRLVATLRSPCQIPSKRKLEDELLPKLYDSLKEIVQCYVASLSGYIALSVEEWNSRSGEVYITLAIHHQYESSQLTLETKVLSTINCPSEADASLWGIKLDNLFTEWNIKMENISAVIVATNQQEILRALSDKGLTLVPCLVHSLQLCISACFELPGVAKILSKCRSAVEVISRSYAATTALRIEGQSFQLQEKLLKLDYPRVWTSTYNMLEQLFVRKGIISSVLENIDSRLRHTVSLNDEEWEVVEDLIMVLEPFMVTLMTLSEEKTPVVSLLKPLLWQMNSSHLQVKETDSETAKTLKRLLSENLSLRYGNSSINYFLHMATTLDPRFKLLPYASEDDKNIISSTIKQMLITFIEDERGKNTGTMEESPNKKSRLSGMELLLGDLCSSKSGLSAEERADLEFGQYQSESVAALNVCPMQWWAKASTKCPNLATLAHKYICAPPSTMPSHRIPYESQVLFDMRRACLQPELVDKLLFLNGNHNG